DRRVRNAKDVEDLAALPPIGAVPAVPPGQERVLVRKDALSLAGESYRTLRFAVQRCGADSSLSTILVTSAQPGEGKSTTSANLAIAFARQHRRVILVDADLRRPTLHTVLQVQPEPGL